MMAGMPDELFWRSSPQEVEAVLERRSEAERGANLRAGLVAAAIVNVFRKKGSAPSKPSDFIRERRKESDFMTPAQAAKVMDRWAASINRRMNNGADA